MDKNQNQNKQWFDVDRKGLAAIMERRGKAFVILELIQNAWDEASTEVRVAIEPVAGQSKVYLTVEDDNPAGFLNLAESWTLFAPSSKVGDAEKRGRFNLGEKLVLALCDEAQIASTTGVVNFKKDGSRSRSSAKKTNAGTVFTATVRMNRDEMNEALWLVKTCDPPAGVKTYIGGQLLDRHDVVASSRVTLPTEIADDEGILRRTARQTAVRLLDARGEIPSIYEMGIPVVEHSDGPWHIDVAQKVPLNIERDNVTPGYLRKLRTAALDMAHQLMDEDEVSKPWVAEAIKDATPDAVASVVTSRFGADAVVYDPSNSEANKRAMEQGRTVIWSGSFDKEGWSAIRRTRDEGKIDFRPAGQVIETGVPTSPDGKPPLPNDEWTDGMRRLDRYTRSMGRELLGYEPTVEFQSIANRHAAWFGSRTITFNVRTLGHRWFNDPDLQAVDRLLIHEFSHDRVSDHLSDAFHDECCRLGARLALAIRQGWKEQI